MLEIQNLQDLGVFSEEDLAESDFAEVLSSQFLNCKMSQCRLISSETSDEADEMYYFIEANGNHLHRLGSGGLSDLLLISISDISVVLLELGKSDETSIYLIFFRDSDEEELLNLF